MNSRPASSSDNACQGLPSGLAADRAMPDPTRGANNTAKIAAPLQSTAQIGHALGQLLRSIDKPSGMSGLSPNRARKTRSGNKHPAPGVPLSGPLRVDPLGLQPVEKIYGALGMGCGGKDKPLIVLQDFEP
jgi:hypothetical protein